MNRRSLVFILLAALWSYAAFTAPWPLAHLWRKWLQQYLAIWIWCKCMVKITVSTLTMEISLKEISSSLWNNSKQSGHQNMYKWSASNLSIIILYGIHIPLKNKLRKAENHSGLTQIKNTIYYTPPNCWIFKNVSFFCTHKTPLAQKAMSITDFTISVN